MSEAEAPNECSSQAEETPFVEDENVAPSCSPPAISVIRSTRGAVQLCIDGFIFSRNKTTGEKSYWECANRKHQKDTSACRAKAVTSGSNETIKLINITEHNHAPMAEAAHVKKARAEIKRMAQSTKNKPCQILQQQHASQGDTSLDIAPSMPTKNALRKVISRVRDTGRPEPKTVAEIDVPEDLRQTISGKKFLQRDIDVGDDKVLIFTTDEDLRNMEKCAYWMADGTFKTAPKVFMQLFSIHACVGGINGPVLPCVYVLMTRRTGELYDVIMQALNELASDANIVLNPKFVLTDFERAEMNSFVREFPSAKSKGCKFHFGQSMYRRIQQYGLAQRYGMDVKFSLKMRQLLALAYLPDGEIEQAFFLIKPDFDDSVAPLLDWFQNTYIVGKKRRHSQSTRVEAMFPPNVWSVHDSVVENIPRTQNIIESWHNRWRHLVGDKPGVYRVIEHIREEEHKVRGQSERALAGICISANKEQQRRDDNIKRLVQDRANKSTEDYLKGIAYNLTL